MAKVSKVAELDEQIQKLAAEVNDEIAAHNSVVTIFNAGCLISEASISYKKNTLCKLIKKKERYESRQARTK